MDIFQRCPKCEAHDYEIVGQKWSESGELYEVNINKCNKCGFEFDDDEADDIRNDEGG